MHACHACPLGQWSAAGAANCSCAAGTYRSPATLQTSGSCSVRPNSLAACSAAAAELGLEDVSAVDDGQSGGMYAAATASASCKDCPEGRYSDQEAQTTLDACKACDAGRYQDQVRTACTNCPPGKHQAAAGNTTCDGNACDAGTFHRDSQTSPVTCTSCPAGKHQDGTGQTDCKGTACAKGKYLPDTNTEATQPTCINCPAGKHQDGTGQTDCKGTACAKGRFYADAQTSAVTCTDCTYGQYQDETGRSGCRKCPAGRTTTAAAETDSNECIRTQCGPGRYSWSNTSKMLCFECPAGQFRDTEINCTKCKRGTFQPEKGRVACKVCALGKHGESTEAAGATRASHCIGCSAGQFGTGVGKQFCSHCPSGRYQDQEGQASCKDAARCAPGKFERAAPTATTDRACERLTNTTDRECTPCAAGRYQAAADAASCKACEQGKFQPEPGQAFCNKLTVCSAGHYSNATNMRVCIQCGSCTSGARIKCGGAFEGVCPRGRRCVEVEVKLRGQDQGRVNITTITTMERCPEHYFAHKGTECVNRTMLSLVLFALVFGAVVACGHRLWTHVCRAWPDKTLAQLAYEMPQIIKLLASTYQIVGSFSESFHAVPWPESYKVFASYVAAIASFDVFGQPIFACQGFGDTYTKRFLWQTLTVLAVVLLFAMLLMRAERAKQARARKRGRSTIVLPRWFTTSTSLWNVLLAFLFIVYPSVSKTTVLMLRCHDLDGARYLLADYGVRCDVPGYAPYRGLAVVFTLLYPVGIPVLFAALLWHNRQKLPPDWWPEGAHEKEQKAFAAYLGASGNDQTARAEWRSRVWRPQMARFEKMEQRFGFLFGAYKHEYYWFETVMTFYKFAMTTLVVFVSGADGANGTTLKILFSMFMATSLIALVSFLQPYKDADVLSIESMVNLELLFVLFAALYLQEMATASGSTGNITGAFLIALLLSPLVAVALLLWRGVRDELALGQQKLGLHGRSGDGLATTTNPMYHAKRSGGSGSGRAGGGRGQQVQLQRHRSLRTRIRETYLSTSAGPASAPALSSLERAGSAGAQTAVCGRL
eukprot:g1643.t1